MNPSFEMDPVERITAGAVGEPGERVFFVQAENAGGQVTLLAEKEQVAALATALEQILQTLPETEEGPPPGEETLNLIEPVEPVWRAGSMSIEYDETADKITITISEAVAEDAEEEPATARFVASRSQVRALSEHAGEVVAAGRPRCQFCGDPLGPDGGHVCPAMNGHRAPPE
ncbi:MAG TPA: DUF3090 family protein [Actinomycetota bacterium]